MKNNLDDIIPIIDIKTDWIPVLGIYNVSSNMDLRNRIRLSQNKFGEISDRKFIKDSIKDIGYLTGIGLLNIGYLAFLEYILNR